jgi:LysM repeat protein
MRFPLFVLLICFTQVLLAQPASEETNNRKYVHYFDNDGLVLIESLEPGMTLYSLSRKYNISIDSIFSANADLDPTSIPLGYPVNIPIYPGSISFAPPSDTDTGIALFYHVQPKETLYRISKIMIGVPPSTLTSLNPSAEQGLSIGQSLLIGWYTPSAIKAPLASYPTMERDSNSLKPKDFILEAHLEGNKIYEQKGLAVWKPGNVNSHYYVLHPSAKVGSYMEITNPMLRRTITAKVAGHIPPGLYQSNVGIVISPSTARALGALDQQFYARWRYVE